MLYNVVQPAIDLRPYIELMLQFEHDGPALSVRNFPAENISLTFSYGDALVEQSTKHTAPYSRITLEGFQSEAMEYTPRGRMGMIIVVLKPWARTMLKELRGSFSLHGNLALEDVYGQRIELLREQIDERTSVSGKIQAAQDFLREIIVPDSVPARANHALELMAQSKGLMTIPEMGKAIGLSKRQFDRVFQADIGTSPKHYARVVRLRNSLRLIHHGTLSLTDVAYEAGYYDQSHFIKDFKQFTGFTPRAFRNFQGTIGNTCHQVQEAERTDRNQAAPTSRASA